MLKLARCRSKSNILDTINRCLYERQFSLSRKKVERCKTLFNLSEIRYLLPEPCFAVITKSMPPRALKWPVTVIHFGSHAATIALRMMLVTSS